MGSHLKQNNNKRARKILAWLRQNPIPRMCRAVHEDGSDVEVVVQPPQGRIRWTDAMRAVYKCSEITALDDAGRILRVLDLEPAAEDEAELNRLEIAHQKMLSEADARLPGREPIISVDVPLLVEKIASAMKDVARTAAEQQSEAHAAGFNAMTNVVTLCISMLQRVDQRLADREEDARELEEERIALLQQQPQPGTDGDPRSALAHAALQKVLGGGIFGGGEPANGKPNGHSAQPDPIVVAKLGEMLMGWAAQNQGGTPSEGES